ncbi:hypothetical protein [Aneurinibacillus migulanus]|nr:hypothetical protein [Aneurinibacillus migulanus]
MINEQTLVVRSKKSQPFFAGAQGESNLFFLQFSHLKPPEPLLLRQVNSI